MHNKEIDKKIKGIALEIDRVSRSVPKRICNKKPAGNLRPVPSLTFMIVFGLWVIIVSFIYLISRSAFLIYFSVGSVLIGFVMFALQLVMDSMKNRVNKKIELLAKTLFDYFSTNHFIIDTLDIITIRIYLTNGFSGEPQAWVEIPIRTMGCASDLFWDGGNKNYHTLCYYKLVINPYIEVGENFKVVTAINDMKFKRLKDVLKAVEFIADTFHDAYAQGFDAAIASLVLKSITSEEDAYQRFIKWSYFRSLSYLETRVIIVDQYSGAMRLPHRRGHDNWKNNRAIIEEATLSDFMWTLYNLREGGIRISAYELQTFTIVTDRILYRFCYDKNPEKIQIKKDRNGLHSTSYEATMILQML